MLTCPFKWGNLPIKQGIWIRSQPGIELEEYDEQACERDEDCEQLQGPVETAHPILGARALPSQVADSPGAQNDCCQVRNTYSGSLVLRTGTVNGIFRKRSPDQLCASSCGSIEWRVSKTSELAAY